jgi:hypothetical protein
MGTPTTNSKLINSNLLMVILYYWKLLFNSVGGTILAILGSGDIIQKDRFGYQEILDDGFINAALIKSFVAAIKLTPVNNS